MAAAGQATLAIEVNGNAGALSYHEISAFAASLNNGGKQFPLIRVDG